MNSREKGKRGEREAAEAMREHLGVEARRGVQYAGGPESPDVKHSIPGVHVEVKRVEHLNLSAAMKQAVTEAPATSVPVVLHRKNKGAWMVTLLLSDVKDFCNAMDAAWSKPQGAQDA